MVQEQPDQTSVTERYTEEAVTFIRENADRPFFLYFAHTYVHNPLFVPEVFERQSENGVLGAAVAHIDWSLAMLEYELERCGLTDDTLIIFVCPIMVARGRALIHPCVDSRDRHGKAVSG